MNRKATHLGTAAVIVGVGLLAALTIPVSGTTEASGTAPVTVMNTPLPVALQGTGSITGNVNAAQSGAWSVGVTTLPAVQLAAGTTVAINGGSVAFDDPAKQAYVVELCASDTEFCDSGTSPSATLPLNTRYVIEQVSGRCYVRNKGIDGWALIARLNGQDHRYPIRDKISAENNESTTGLFFEQTKIYSDGGVVNGLSVDVLSSGFEDHEDLTPEALCDITLSGYLVQTGVQFPTP